MTHINITSHVDDSQRLIKFTCLAEGVSHESDGFAVYMALGSLQIATLHFGKTPEGNYAASAEIRASTLLKSNTFNLFFTDNAGAPLSSDVSVACHGLFFDAIGIKTPEKFYASVQAHHSRYTSPVLLEIAARCAYCHFPENNNIRMASQVVIGHRLIERFSNELDDNDLERTHGFITAAVEEIRLANMRIESMSPLYEWEPIRWTISLSTVAGFLAIACERYDHASSLFESNVKLIDTIETTKVSALNFVVSCLLLGLVSDFLGNKTLAKRSFISGLNSCKLIVQTQILTENVWVIGDLINVLQVSKQCFVSLVRLGYMHTSAPYPVIEEDMQIDLGTFQSTFPNILNRGHADRFIKYLHSKSAIF